MRHDRGGILNKRTVKGLAQPETVQDEVSSPYILLCQRRLGRDLRHWCPGTVLSQAETTCRYIGEAQEAQTRESEVWGRIVDQVGHPAAGATISMFVIAQADDFEFYLPLFKK